MMLRMSLACLLLAATVAAKEECSDAAPSGQLTGQLAVITGASRGVGAEIARVYAREGALVVVNFFKSKDKGEAVAAEINAQYGPRALALYGDVTVKEDMAKLVAAAEAHYGQKVSVVVNNALARYQFNPSSPMASIKTVTKEGSAACTMLTAPESVPFICCSRSSIDTVLMLAIGLLGLNW